ncbi:MAG: sigma-70 family RNA polymerase sigma factor [Candidatus Zixiibacteriota bacterium]|nr:MAG: sigma-70 family RNA polymerase sigma factor [candidate division Zixibacteria bacterium]
MATDTRGSDFGRIFGEHQKPVYNYVLRMVKESSVAEELTQDIFVKVYRSLSEYRGDSAISTWIYRIATNACLDYFRSRPHKKSGRTDSFTSEDLLKSSLPKDRQEVPNAEEELISAEMSSCVRGYIDELPEDYRAVILLHDLQGFTNPEIAKITDSTLENVKIRLHRARRKMKEVFSDKCSFYRDERNVLRCVEKEESENGDDQ